MTSSRTPLRWRSFLASLLCFLGLFSVGYSADAKKQFDLPADTAERSLKRLAEQSGREVLFSADAVEGIRTKAVKGEMIPGDALDAMLAGTPLVGVKNSKTGALTVRLDKSVEEAEKNANRAIAPNSVRPEKSQKSEADVADGVIKLETFEVMGSKLLNMDIPRSRDGAQPYVIFNRDVLERSGATSINDFLKTRLTMSAVEQTPEQSGSSLGGVSQVNLRGLGANQTLILIDGRRAARTPSGFSPSQSDLNGIPLSAIERIEVLPTTASAIYGGSATGGVINVILRRNYTGAQIGITYDNTFESDSAIKRVDVSVGVTSDNQRLNLLFTGSYSETNQLSTQDRDFYLRGRARLLQNNPTALQPGSSPPSGTTTNIRSADGSNLVLKSGLLLNSPITHLPTDYSGVASDSGAALAANAGSYSLGLGNNALAGSGGNSALLFEHRTTAYSLTTRYKLTRNIDVFLEGSDSTNHNAAPTSTLGGFSTSLAANNPNNPFTQTVQVNAAASVTSSTIITDLTSNRAAAGAVIRLPAGWMGEADYTWTRARYHFQGGIATTPAMATAITNGTLNLLQSLSANQFDSATYLYQPQTSQTPLTSTARDLTVRCAGSVFRLPAGPVSLSVLAEEQHQSYSAASSFAYSGGSVSQTYFPPRSQSIDSIYTELNVPLFSAAKKAPFAQELDLQIAGRIDEYKNRSAANVSLVVPAPVPVITSRDARIRATSPLLALRYKPFSDITLRGSYSKGFLPPEVNQVGIGTQSSTASSYIDPKRGNTGPIGTYNVLTGASGSLAPERATSWSGGIIMTPHWMPSLRVSIDYTRVEKENNITTLSTQQVLDLEDALPGRVIRNPNLSGDQPGWAGPVSLIDLTLVNVSRTKMEAFDVALEYSKIHAFGGEVTAYFNGTWQTHLIQQVTPKTAAFDTVGYASTAQAASPSRFKGNAGLTWERGMWTIGWSARYFSSYWAYTATASASTRQTAITNQGGNGRVSSQIYNDVFVSTRFAHSSGHGSLPKLFRDLDIQIGVRNVFNVEPPFDANNTLRFYSFYGDPRLASYYLKLTKRL